MLNLLSGYIVIPLSERNYGKLDKLFHVKQTTIPRGYHTDTHHHKWFSFYLTKNNMLQELPFIQIPFGLFIVLPFAKHTWTNRIGKDDCRVGDLSTHADHQLIVG